jgi:hypothetical protein
MISPAQDLIENAAGLRQLAVKAAGNEAALVHPICSRLLIGLR